MIPKVKICGLTQLDDAVVAAEEGADFLGFIFYPKSKRLVDEKQVLCMVKHLRSFDYCPTLVGVFVDFSAETISQILDYTGLDLAQLHGGEPPKLIGDLTSPLYKRSYKALRPQSYTEAEADAEWFLPPSPNPDLPQLLVDAYHPNEYGGTGIVSDWDMAQKLTVDVPQLLLAGGLTPANVTQAIHETGVWGVDVASGVEASPGIKDQDAVRAFIRAAKQARS